jgi:hypothetical protein
MATLSETPEPGAIESEARSIWAARRLPPLRGPVGASEGPVVQQFLGSFAAQEAGMLALQRTVAADVDARALILAGRRAKGILRKEDGGPPTPVPPLDPLLTALGVWVGGSDGRGWDSPPRRPEVERLVGRLAHLGAIAVRDLSIRICPACATARSPERIVYQEEDGETLLVRFPFPEGDRTVSALVWTDAPWRLLGTSALMVHPDLPYVVARYRRRETEEFVFTSKSSLDRLRSWLPGADIEVVEEHPGRYWEGRAYTHPLRHEFPMGGGLAPPAGTILSINDVSDSGTGVVPLVPGHGGTDTQIADRLNVPGWPLVTPKGRFDVLFVHKYAGLELDSGSEFVERDLDEGGAIFARLRVRRGVPHCVRCGTALIWAPGRAWCLEPSRLPEEKVAIYRSLLPHARPIEKLEAVPWPVSEPQRSDDPLAISLLECTSCDRLESLEKEAERCVCGGRRRRVRRRLLSAFDTAATSWAAVDPFPPGDAARLYVNERRRVPAVVHHIAAMSGVGGTVGEVRLTVLPTVPESEIRGLISTYGADAVRSTFVRAQASEGATGTFSERCAQERRRLEAFWKFAGDILSSLDSRALSEYLQPITGAIGELEPEDRALLARFERLRLQAAIDFERSTPERVHRRLFEFFENDLATYREWVTPRLALDGNPPAKRAAFHTLVHSLFGATLLLGPIAPHTAELVHQSLRQGRGSLFEETTVEVDRVLLDETRVSAWDRWISVIRSLDRFRRGAGVPPNSVLPSAVLVVDSEPVANAYRAEASTVERLARVQKVEVGSSTNPWTGRRRQLRPREAEIQRVYANRAAQIIHLLRRMPERKWADPASGQEFSMIVNGQPTLILPSMIDWVETLPERVVPVGWSRGELYAELPAGRTLATAPPPPLSPDGFRLVARVAHRIRSYRPESPPVVVVAAPPALAAELSGVSDAISRYLGVREFRVVPSDREMPPHDLGFGRTKSGGAWSFHVAGRAPPSRPVKIRPRHAHGARVRPAYAPGDLAPTVTNYADDDLIAREGAIRLLGEELDEILGAPLLGPAKVRAAWDTGLQTVDAFRQAPWDTLAALPGVGGPIATAIVTKFGGVVPPRPPRSRRTSVAEPTAPTHEPIVATSPQWSGPPVQPSASPSLPAEAVLREIVPPPPALLPAIIPQESPAIVPPVATSTSAEDRPQEPSDDALAPETPAQAEQSPPDPTGSSADAPPVPVLVPEVRAATADSILVDLRMPEPNPLAELSAETESADSSPAPSLASSAAVDSLDTRPEEARLVEEAGEARAAASEPMVLPDSGLASPDPMVGPLTEESLPPPPPMTASDSDARGRDAEVTVSSDSTETGILSPPLAEPAEVRLTEAGPSFDDSPEPSGEASPVAEIPSTEPPPLSLTDVPSSPPSTSSGPTPPPAVEVPEREIPPLPIPPPVLPSDGPEGVPTNDSPEATEPPPSSVEAPTPPSPVASGIEDDLRPSPPAEARAPISAPAARAEPPSDTAEVALLPPSAESWEPAVPVAAPLPSGGIELVVAPSYVPTLERFLDATAAGHQGVCIVRDSPERVRAYIGSRPVEIRWLTNIGRGPTLKPSDLEGFSAFLAHAVSTGHVTAFFLEGIEYLVRLHGLEKVVDRMSTFDRLAREHSARVWVPMNPKLLSSTELERFVAVFGSGGVSA